MSSARNPQLWRVLAMTALKAPGGASVSPQMLRPQQVIVLLARNPQLWRVLAMTALKAPGGASVCPSQWSSPSR